MSMICVMHATPPAELDEVLANPELVFERYLNIHIEALLAQATSVPWLNQWNGNGGAAAAQADSMRVELDKAWHGLHFLLTGSSWGGQEPLCYLVKGGQEIGEDLGYGPARVLRPQQVKAFHAALSRISTSELESRFDHAAMRAARLYSIGESVDDAGEDQEYLLEYYEVLQDFVAQAAGRGQGIVTYLS
jgi:hypothetical protein